MLIIQMTGLSGAGKTTLAYSAVQSLLQQGYTACVVDGDVYRQTLCRDLGFSPADRMENIRRLGRVAAELSAKGNMVIIAAINPFDAVRQELHALYAAPVVHVDCPLEELTRRDTKGLYKRAMLSEGHPEKLYNLTGVNDVYERPANPALHLQTDQHSLHQCSQQLVAFMLSRLP